MEVKREKEQEEEEKMVMDNSSKQTETERVRKGKSCKGTLYFSSHLKSKGRNPRCVGITRSLQQVPNYIVSESEVEASKEGRSLTDFKYACVGYSIYMDQNKDAPLDGDQKPRAELPVCVGVEFLVDKRPTDHHAPTPAHNREVGSDSPVGVDLLRGRVLCCMTHGFYACRKAEMEDWHQFDDHGHHQHRPPKTTHPMGEEFLTRFQRNAGLVASGVARNMRKVGNYVKESIDDILYRRPK